MWLKLGLIKSGPKWNLDGNVYILPISLMQQAYLCVCYRGWTWCSKPICVCVTGDGPDAASLSVCVLQGMDLMQQAYLCVCYRGWTWCSKPICVCVTGDGPDAASLSVCVLQGMDLMQQAYLCVWYRGWTWCSKPICVVWYRGWTWCSKPICVCVTGDGPDAASLSVCVVQGMDLMQEAWLLGWEIRCILGDRRGGWRVAWERQVCSVGPH